MISYIVRILYASWFIGFLRRFILSYQWSELRSWVVILVLFFTPTRGTLFVPMQWWHNLWSINFMTVQLCLRPSGNSRCETLHKIQSQIWRSALISSISYPIVLNIFQMIWLRSRVTRTPSTIFCGISRIESFESKHHQHNSRLTALFLSMVLSMER